MLENVDIETLKQIGLVIGTVITGAVAGAIGVWKSKRNDPDDMTPVTKQDLQNFLDQDRSVQLRDLINTAIAAFEKDAKADRAVLYGRLDALKADTSHRQAEFEQRWMEYVRDQQNKHEDHEERLRTVEITLGPGGRRRT